MSFPTWDKIKKELKISDTTNPNVKFGNCPFQKSSQPLWEICEQKYKDKKIGIDVPVLLEREGNKNKRVIVILGESPLRKDSQFTGSNNVILGTPYAIHLDEDSFPKQCSVYKEIFDGLLEKGYSLYLTDIIKLWGENENSQKQTCFDVFREEIKELEEQTKSFKIVTIVTFGKKAAKAIEQMKNEVSGILDFSQKLPQHIELPHPSTQNWNNWKSRILEDYVLKNNIRAAQSFCNDYNNREEGKAYKIIAKEALRIIDEGLKNYE